MFLRLFFDWAHPPTRFSILSPLSHFFPICTVQRKGGHAIFTANSHKRDAAAKYRALDYAEKRGFMRGIVRDIVHDAGRGAPLAKVEFRDPYKHRTVTETFIAAEGIHTGMFFLLLR